MRAFSSFLCLRLQNSYLALILLLHNVFLLSSSKPFSYFLPSLSQRSFFFFFVFKTPFLLSSSSFTTFASFLLQNLSLAFSLLFHSVLILFSSSKPFFPAFSSSPSFFFPFLCLQLSRLPHRPPLTASSAPLDRTRRWPRRSPAPRPCTHTSGPCRRASPTRSSGSSQP